MSIVSTLLTAIGASRRARFSTTPAGEPFWSYVALLVNGDDLVDHSDLKLVCTTSGSTDYTTTTEKYGTGSVRFPGAGNSLYVAANTETLLGFSNDFTVEFWCYILSNDNGAGIIGCWDMNNFTGSQSWVIAYDNSGKITATIKISDETTTLSTTAGTLTSNAWHHVAFVRYGNTFTLYIDGASIGSFTYAGAIAVGPNKLTMNGYNNGGYSFDGFLDDIRITKDYARYTKAFVAPINGFASSYGPDSSTPSLSLSPFLLGDTPFFFGVNEVFTSSISMGTYSPKL